jgi:hypothetical protein
MTDTPTTARPRSARPPAHRPDRPAHDIETWSVVGLDGSGGSGSLWWVGPGDLLSCPRGADLIAA